MAEYKTALNTIGKVGSKKFVQPMNSQNTPLRASYETSFLSSLEKRYCETEIVHCCTWPWASGAHALMSYQQREPHCGEKDHPTVTLSFEWNFRHVIFTQIVVIDGWGISCEIALIWMSLDFTDDQSTLVQVMVWCRQATSHYLSQCWPRSMPHMSSLGHNELSY